MAKVKRPAKNSLWSRKDARRPGVVRVVGTRNQSSWTSSRPWVYVKWEDTNTGRTGEVQLEQWERRYRPFTAPTQGTPTSPPSEQEK